MIGMGVVVSTEMQTASCYSFVDQRVDPDAPFLIPASHTRSVKPKEERRTKVVPLVLQAFIDA